MTEEEKRRRQREGEKLVHDQKRQQRVLEAAHGKTEARMARNAATPEMTLKVNYDLNTLNNESAARLASQVADETERDNLLNSYIGHVKKKSAPNYMENAPTYKEMRAKTNSMSKYGVYEADKAEIAKKRGETRQAENALAGVRLYDRDGNLINTNTADTATVMLGLRLMPDGPGKNEALAALDTLSKDKSSRFYGVSFDKKDLAFMDDAALTQSEYGAAVSEYGALFHVASGFDEENAQAYMSSWAEIDAQYPDKRANAILKNALSESYTARTGQKPPSPEAMAAAQEQAAQAQQAEPKEKQGFAAWLKDLFSPSEEEAQDAPKEARQAEDTLPKAERTRESVAATAYGGMAREVTPAAKPKEEAPRKKDGNGFWEGLTGKAPEDDGRAMRTPTSGEEEPSSAEETAPEKAEREAGEVYGPARQPRTGEAMGFDAWRAAGMPVPQAKEGAEEPKRHAATLAEAVGALYSGTLDQIEGEGLDELNRLMENPAARRLAGALSDEENQRIKLNNDPAEAITRYALAENGRKLMAVRDMVNDDSFPAELRDDGQAMMLVWAARAHDMEASGTLGGDRELPLMERLLTTDETSMDELATLYRARDELNQQAAELRAERTQAGEQTLADARSAVMNGQASDAQREMVLENANVTPAQVYADDGYWDYMVQAGAYMNDAEGFDAGEVKQGLNAQGVLYDADYRQDMQTQMEAIVEEDARTAIALGMTLEGYYQKIGGMDMGTLAQRAATRITQQGASITQEEAAALDAPYGEGVGAGYVLGAGVRTGGEQWYMDFKESLYTGLSNGQVDRTAARMQSRYEQEYGLYGRTQYAHELTEMATSGALSEEKSKALLRAVATAADVYQIGLDPQDTDGVLLKGNAQIRRDIDTAQGYIRQYGTEGENRWFYRVKGATYNTVSAAVSTGVSAATGSTALGFITGYSVPGFSSNVDEYLAKGYKPRSAVQLATANTGLDYLVNIGTFDKVIGQITGGGAMIDAAKDFAKRNPAGVSKGWAAVRAGAKAFVSNEFDEAVHDELLESMAGNWVENALGGLYRKLDAGEDIGFCDMLDMTISALNPQNLDVMGAAGNVADGFAENCIGSVLFSLAGAGGAAASEYKSVKMAQEIASGRSGDVAGAMAAVARDLKDPAFRQTMNAEAEQQKEDRAVAQALVSGKSEAMTRAAKAKEQQASHKAQADASAQAMDNANAVMDECIAALDAGDTSEEMTRAYADAAQNYARAGTGYDEHSREYAQKKQEAETAFGEGLSEARAAAKRMLAAQDEAARAALAEDRSMRRAALQREADAAGEMMEALNKQLEAGGGDADALINQMEQTAERQGNIYAEMDALDTQKADEANAQRADARRAAAERALAQQEAQAVSEMEAAAKREQAQAELDEMESALKELRTSPVYIDPTQAANILHRTGLKSIPQVNIRYGIKLRTDREKAQTSLDGSFYAGLAEMAPGQMDAQSGHPEEAILDLLDRRNALRSELQASLGETDTEAFLPEGASYGTGEAVMATLASRLYKATGTELIVANIGKGTRGLYDRSTGRLFISNHIGVGEQMRQVAAHELTHYIEHTPGYDAYRDAALAAAYKGDEDAMERDAQRIREDYEAAGHPLDEAGVESELAAIATEYVLDEARKYTGTDTTENLLDELLGEKQKLPVRLLGKVTGFLARRRAQKQGENEKRAYDAIIQARDGLKKAIAQAGKWQKGKGADDQTMAVSEDKLRRGEVQTDSEQTRMQYAVNRGSHYDYSKPFAQQVKELQEGKIPEKDALIVGGTPDIWQKVGMSALPVTINQEHVRAAVDGTRDTEHNISREMIAQLPELIADPIAIIESESSPDGGVVVLVNAVVNGKPYVAPVYVSSTSNQNGLVIDSNNIATVFRKGNAVEKLLTNAIQKEKDANSVGVFYLKKSEARNLYDVAGVQFPGHFLQDGLNHSIFDAGSPVNRKFMEQTETRQFKHWFGDSKVVDEDGKPLVMYHGTKADNGDFTIFDYDKAKKKGGKGLKVLGKGNYFTSQKLDGTESYGSRVIPAYLSIRNPFVMKPEQSFTTEIGNALSLAGESYDEIQQKMREAGYDGVIKVDERGRVKIAVAFDSTQIKSATENVGLFDPKNPDIRYSLGLRMFGNETAQRMDALSDEVKALLKGTAYEKTANREQLQRANEIIDRQGIDEAASALMSRAGMWNAEDTVLAATLMARANGEGLHTTEMMIATAYNEMGTVQGQALQARQIALRLTPSGAMTETVRKANEENKRRGIPKGSIPVGNQPPAKPAGENRKLPKVISRVYDQADGLKRVLDELPQDVSRNNEWGLPLNPAQEAAIDYYHLRGVSLPGATYSRASQKQRMLMAILATPNNVRGDGLLTLCQQLEGIKAGLSVVTEADLNYIAGQMGAYLAAEGESSGVPATQEGKAALARAYDAQANITPATFIEKWNAERYMNMLSGTTTAVRNVASNVLMSPLEKTATAIASGIDAWVAKQTGTRTTALASRAEVREGKAAFAKEIAQTFSDYMITHTDTSHGRKYFEGERGRVFQTEWMETYRNLVDFAMQIGDRPFYEQCYAEELAVIHRLGVKKRDADSGEMRDMTEEEMRQEAVGRAVERVFQEDSMVVDWINRGKNIPVVGKAIQVLVPFTKTPTNIAMRMLDYSPFGLAKTLVWDGLHGMNAKNGADFDQRRFVMNVGRGMTGTGLMLAGMLLAQAGVLAFGRGDEEDRKLAGVQKALGKPYSAHIRLFGKAHEIEWAMPGAAGLIAGASIAKRLADEETLSQALIVGPMNDMVNQLFSSTMLSAVNDIFRGYDDPSQIAKNVMATTASSAMNQTLSPGFIRQFAKATDPYVRDVASQDLIWGALKSGVIQNWPGLRQMLPIKTDMTGDAVLAAGAYSWGKDTQNAVMHMLDSYLTPTATVGEKNDAALLELADMAYRTGETGFLPGELLGASQYELTVSQTLAKELRIGRTGIGKYASFKIHLTDAEKRRANAEYGDLLFNGGGGAQGLRQMMASDAWQRMSDAERMEKVKKAQTEAKNKVIRRLAQDKKEDGEIQ